MVSCGKCGANGVKIYRQYGCFRRPETDRCNACIDPASRDWMVPCIEDENGNAWGYTSVPEEACEAFYELPDKSDDHPTWTPTQGWSSDG